jgi:hypothetical protein
MQQIAPRLNIGGKKYVLPSEKVIMAFYFVGQNPEPFQIGICKRGARFLQR